MRGAYPSTDQSDLEDAVKALATAVKMPEEANKQRHREVRAARSNTEPLYLACSEVYGDGDWADELLSRT